MTMSSDVSSSIVRLNIGGKKFSTTVDTLTQREPHSMLAAMFSGRHTVYKDSENGYVFVDRDGKHFRHILNWLRDGAVPNLTDLECSELLREAEYYQLLGLVDGITEVFNKRKEDEEMDTDIIKCVQSEKVRKVGKRKAPAKAVGKRKVRGRKAAKDPNKPKRPPCAFFVFLEEFRKTFKKENPTVKAVSAVGKAGGQMWKSLSNAEKVPYEVEAYKRRSDYAKLMNTYYNNKVSMADDDDEESGQDSGDDDEDEDDDEDKDEDDE